MSEQSINRALLKNEAFKIMREERLSPPEIAARLGLAEKEVRGWANSENWVREILKQDAKDKRALEAKAKLPEFSQVVASQYAELCWAQQKLKAKMLKDEEDGRISSNDFRSFALLAKNIIEAAGTEIIGTDKNEITNILINFDKSDKNVVDVEAIDDSSEL